VTVLYVLAGACVLPPDGNTTLPTVGGGVTVLYGVNLGRILPLPDGTWGPLANVSFGGVNGTK
jgi:hypothetical protein